MNKGVPYGTPLHRCFALLGDGTGVRCLWALLARCDIELDLLSLIEVLETVTRDGAEMHEDIRASVIGSDETEALFRAEPLDYTSCHEQLPSLLGRPGFELSGWAAAVSGDKGTARSELR